MGELEKYPALSEYYVNTQRIIDESINHYCKIFSSREFLEKIKTTGDYDFRAFKEGMVDPILHALQVRKGKRLRPLVTRLAHDLVRVEKSSYIHLNDLLIMPEAIHQASLINDDITDKTIERNKIPTTHIQFGNEIAGNAGDLLYFAAKLPLIFPELFLRNDSPIEEKKREMINKILDKQMLKLHIGQGTDIFWSLGGYIEGHKEMPTEQQYIQMAGNKGGTIPLAMEFGGVLGGATKEEITILGEIGEKLAIAFQLRDDILEMTVKTLSDYGEDIKNRHITMPLILTMEKEKYRDEIRKIMSDEYLRNNNEGDAVEEAINIIKESGSLKESQKIAEDYAQDAIKLVRGNFNKKPKKQRKVLEELIGYSASRDH